MSKRGADSSPRRSRYGPSARQWLAGAVTAWLSVATISHALSGPEVGAEDLPAAAEDSLHTESAPPAATGDAGLERRRAAQLAAMARRLDAWERDARDWRARQREIWEAERAGRERLDGLMRRQEPQLSQLERRLQSLEQGQAQLLALARAGAAAAADEDVPFVFRGTEVWNGQVYALLEHEGRILSARQGEARLGWRVRAIDREQRSLRISDGRAEHTLEER